MTIEFCFAIAKIISFRLYNHHYLLDGCPASCAALVGSHSDKSFALGCGETTKKSSSNLPASVYSLVKSNLVLSV